MTVEQVENIINGLPFVTIEESFKVDSDGTIKGYLGIHDPCMPNALKFRTEIYNVYPCKYQGEEPIHFFNETLLDYPHIMHSGSLCFHTTYWTNEEDRLRSDLTQLNDWVKKYYIGGKIDENYEHLVVNPSVVNGSYYALHFTQPDIHSIAGEYGIAAISELRTGIHKGKEVRNFLLDHYGENKRNNVRQCTWNNLYKGHNKTYCPYVVLNRPPAIYNKFVPQTFAELEQFLTSEQMSFLHLFERRNVKKRKGQTIPILIGYSIPENRLHWQAAIVTIGEFPTYGIPVSNNNVKTGEWKTSFLDCDIDWAMTFDSSRELFFGRGCFNDNFAQKNILVLGVGAIGSMVARTLAKCGCQSISLCDYDIKKPENICRSEYDFVSGACDKSFELSRKLSEECPQIHAVPMTDEIEGCIKLIPYGEPFITRAKELLSNFDIIFDCTTDDDTMVIMETLCIDARIVNLSITNHANELVCAFSPNVSSFVNTVFNRVLKNDSNDLYEPTGCWSPTFKASYNDIALMVQYAMRYIYRMLTGEESIHNFILQDTDGGLKIIRY